MISHGLPGTDSLSEELAHLKMNSTGQRLQETDPSWRIMFSIANSGERRTGVQRSKDRYCTMATRIFDRQIDQ